MATTGMREKERMNVLLEIKQINIQILGCKLPKRIKGAVPPICLWPHTDSGAGTGQKGQFWNGKGS